MNKSDKRKKFFEVTLKLFHEKGFKATTMRDIAIQMNFEVANIYNYIKSKQSILENYLFDLSSEFHSNIDLIQQSSDSPLEKLEAVVAFHVKLTAAKPYEVALLVNDWRNLKEPKLSAFLAERKEYESKVQHLVAQNMDAESIRRMDLKIATQTILASVRWLYDYYTDHGDELNSDKMEKEIISFILKGIEK